MSNKGRGDYSIADVVKVLLTGSRAEKLQVAKFFPAITQASAWEILEDAFGDKKAVGVEAKLRLAAGEAEDEPGESAPEHEQPKEKGNGKEKTGVPGGKPGKGKPEPEEKGKGKGKIEEKKGKSKKGDDEDAEIRKLLGEDEDDA